MHFFVCKQDDTVVQHWPKLNSKLVHIFTKY